MNLFQHLKNYRFKVFRAFYRILPIKKNKLIVWSDSFKAYGCNPKYLVEYLAENLPDTFDIVWVTDATLPVPVGINKAFRIVKYFSLSYLYELHTAHFIICNARTSDSYFFKKRKGQVYIQTWHSSLRLKTIEKDAEKYLPENYINAAKSDSKKIDYIISGCEFSTNIFKNSFWYSGKVLNYGTPRIDYLLNSSKTEELFSKIGISDEFKYVLYAPTFRNDKDFVYDFDFEKIVLALEQSTGEKWRILYRLHPNLTFDRRTNSLSDICIDVSRYPDMQELMLASDMLITDYSSCMFDAAYTKKPCILFMKDYEKYTSSERNLYFDIFKLPFPKAYLEEELANELANFSIDAYNQNIDLFLKDIGSYETGNACKKITELIKELI